MLKSLEELIKTIRDRKYNPIEHWHVEESNTAMDVFTSLSKVIPTNPFYFLRKELVSFSRLFKSSEICFDLKLG